MILATNFEDAKFFNSKTGYLPTPAFNGMKLTDKYGNLRIMVGFDFWTPNSVQMHIYIANPKFVTRKFITEVFNYAFVTCGRGLVIGITPSDNTLALEFNRRIGFREVYHMQDAWAPGIHMVVQEMRSHECKWVRKH